MKSLSVKLGVILFGPAIFTNAEVWGTDWKIYTDNVYYCGYYDAESITRHPKNIARARVLVKWYLSEKGILDWVRQFGKTFESLSYLIALCEMNCTEKWFIVFLTSPMIIKG